MSRPEEGNEFLRLLSDGYARVFYRNWPVWLGGLLIGLVSIVTFAWARPLGVVGGLKEWVDWAFYYAGIYGSHPHYAIHLSSSSLLTFGLIWGAFSVSLLSREFAIKIPPPFEVGRAVFGGMLMGIGSAMAMGCNIGGFFSATSALSLSGLAMMAGLIFGAFLETRYIYWEMQTMRFRRGDGVPRKPGEGDFDWRRIQPYLGSLALLAAFIAVYLYHARSHAAGDIYEKAGGLLLCGMAFGVVLRRSRFAFLQSFREPFVNGSGEQARGVAIAVIVSVIGFAALKSTGLRPENVYVAPNFWVGSFLGGVVFGFGMPFAGGCASGICWRTADGNIKQVIAFVFMGIANSVSSKLIYSSPKLSALMGKRVFLPDYISYHGSLALIIVIMFAYFLVASWNERTKAFV